MLLIFVLYFLITCTTIKVYVNGKIDYKLSILIVTATFQRTLNERKFQFQLRMAFNVRADWGRPKPGHGGEGNATQNAIKVRPNGVIVCEWLYLNGLCYIFLLIIYIFLNSIQFNSFHRSIIQQFIHSFIRSRFSRGRAAAADTASIKDIWINLINSPYLPAHMYWLPYIRKSCSGSVRFKSIYTFQNIKICLFS